MARNLCRSIFLWIGDFCFVLQDLIFAIRTDWFFSLGINFLRFSESAQGPVSRKLRLLTGDFCFVLQDLIFAIRTDWFFSLGINFLRFSESAQGPVSRKLRLLTGPVTCLRLH